MSGGLSWLAEGRLLFDSEGGQNWGSMVMRCNGTEARNVLRVHGGVASRAHFGTE